MRVGLLCFCVGLAGCGADNAAPAKPAPPATVANPVPEGGLTTITLTDEAVKRLGIEAVAAQVQKVSRTRSIAGEVMAPPGGAVAVTAPAAGTLQAAGAGAPVAGARVTKGQSIFTLFAIQPPDRDLALEASRDAASAEAELTMATQRLQRLERLLSDGAASARSVEEARAQQRVADATATAARAREKELRNSPNGTGAGVAVRAPISGVLRSVTAAPGQTVASSAPLFEIVQTDTLWVRVPLFVGERTNVDTAKSATVTTLAGGQAIAGTPVTGPPTADPANATTDLFYSLEQSKGLVPGDRVSVDIPLSGEDEALVIPTAAVVYDLNGGTWVYERTDAHKFVRRRVELRGQIGVKALITRGVAPGTQVVTSGAPELFGTEFGVGK
jgi:RND family efflux transporter MFP subunit